MESFKKLNRMGMFLLIIGGVFSVGEHAFAYIDPGTGMAVATGIGAWLIGILAFCFGAISLTYKKWINGLKKFFSFIKGKLTAAKK